ncbi:MAG TPA: hypothetical protein VLG66_07890 [Alphaproteobacteria bacterium]|nr:hypothetical protein [Alphaproteobacteria bacterium]
MPNAGVKQQIAAITAAMPPPVSSLRSSIACVLDDTRHAAINDHANVCNRYGLNKNRHHINVNAAMRRDARLMIGALAAATGRHVDTIGYYKIRHPSGGHSRSCTAVRRTPTGIALRFAPGGPTCAEWRGRWPVWQRNAMPGWFHIVH